MVNGIVGVMTAEDPYVSMEKDQLISMIHFLVKREEERVQENLELSDSEESVDAYVMKNGNYGVVYDQIV